MNVSHAEFQIKYCSLSDLAINKASIEEDIIID